MMKLHIPKVSGIMASDSHGAISKDGGTITKASEPHVQRLDREILRSYLFDIFKSYDEEEGESMEAFGFEPDYRTRPVVVVGKNTYSDMGCMISNMAKKPNPLYTQPIYIITDSVSVSILDPDVSTTDYSRTINTDTPSSVAVAEAYTHAIQHRSEIVVLGGVSVYKMFRGMYDEFVHVQINGDLGDSTCKYVKVTEDLGCVHTIYPTTRIMHTPDVIVDVFQHRSMI